MKDLVARVQRELPDTDRTRYDIAYERGRAQARSGLLVGGLAVGSALGAGLMWLLDPIRGSDRRAQLTARVSGLTSALSRTATAAVGDIQSRVQGAPAERGTDQPDGAEVVAAHSTNGSRYGQGYLEGFGQTVNDPVAPGSRVPDPIEPEEALRYGASGPVAGAAVGYDESEVKPLSDEERATNR